MIMYLSDGAVADDDAWVGQSALRDGGNERRTFDTLHGHPGLLRCAANPVRGCFQAVEGECGIPLYASK